MGRVVLAFATATVDERGWREWNSEDVDDVGGRIPFGESRCAGAVLGLGPEWKVTKVEPTRDPKETSGGVATDRREHEVHDGVRGGGDAVPRGGERTGPGAGAGP